MRKETLDLLDKLAEFSKDLQKAGKRLFKRELELFINELKINKAEKIKRILDIGCGDGAKTLCLSTEFKDIKFLGADKDKKKIGLARRYAEKYEIKSKFCLTNINSLPFKQSYFDGIISTRVFHHMKKKDKSTFLKEISRVLKHGSFIFMEEFLTKYTIYENTKGVGKRYYDTNKSFFKLAERNGLSLLNKRRLRNSVFKYPLWKLTFQKIE